MTTPRREERELKTPQERAFRDEEAEAVPAESVHLEWKTTVYLETYIKTGLPPNVSLTEFGYSPIVSKKLIIED